MYVVPHTNQGLCSFNDVVPRLPGRAAILLNNDVKLAADAIDPLVAPLAEPPAATSAADGPCFMTAARCLSFDGSRYEGQKTALAWRWGLVQATSLFAGHEPVILQPDLTASAGAAIAVDRDVFTQLGGFDPLYLPGRVEDLDFAFRGYQAGYSPAMCRRRWPGTWAWARSSRCSARRAAITWPCATRSSFNGRTCGIRGTGCGTGRAWACGWPLRRPAPCWVGRAGGRPRGVGPRGERSARHGNGGRLGAV